MNKSIKKGVGFGLTSGIITTLGMIIGLNSSTSSKTAVIGGIVVIAIADALSDALGIHISEESTNVHTTKEIWEATTATFCSKFVFALIFIFPFLFFSLHLSIIICVIMGLSLIAIFSVYLAQRQKIPAYKAVFEHIFIAIVVIIAAHYVGEAVKLLTISA